MTAHGRWRKDDFSESPEAPSEFVLGALFYALWMLRHKKPRNYIEHETPADGNVFLSLVFPPEEAARLLAETDLEIDEIEAARKSKEDLEQTPMS